MEKRDRTSPGAIMAGEENHTDTAGVAGNPRGGYVFIRIAGMDC